MTSRVMLALVFAAGAALAQTRVEYDVQQPIARETFEAPGPRAGNPELIREDIAPAVFVKAAKGVYTVPSDKLYDGVTALLPGPYTMRLPDGPDAWLMVGFTLHRFTNPGDVPAAKPCSARFFIGPAADVQAGRQDLYTLPTGFGFMTTLDPAKHELTISLFERFGGANAPGRLLYQAVCRQGNLPLGMRLFLSRDRYALSFTKAVETTAGRSVGEQGFGRAIAVLPSPDLQTGLRLVNHEAGVRSQMVIGEFEAAQVRVKELQDLRPEARPKRRFKVAEDPAYKLIWSDEFDGTAIDTTKWRVADQGPRDLGEGMPKSYLRPSCVRLDGQGHVAIKFGLDAQGYLESGDLSSIFNHTYGYYEARLKLTRQPGWWAAFWLNRPNPGPNPFTNGLEIDVLEDFWQKSRKDDTLQHALHIGVPSPYGKSFTQDAHVPNWDDWHTLAVDWQPQEMIVYVDGVETACFDRTQGVTTQPCQILLSGCIGSKAAAFTGSYRDAELPEEFVVDYVRVYERTHPGKQPPAVTLNGEGRSVRLGDRVTVEAVPTGGKVQEVSLFDNGYLLATRTQPPYRFEVTFAEDWFQQTDYYKRSTTRGVTGLLSEHVLVAMVKDADGLIGASAPIEFNLESGLPSRPYHGVAQVIPGTLKLPLYDEGGQGVAYLDGSLTNDAPGTTFREDEGVDTAGETIGWTAHGEWLKYTVDIARAGRYTVRAPFGCGLQTDYTKGLRLELDGERLGDLPMVGVTAGSWGLSGTGTLKGVELPAGRHVLTVRILGGGINLNTITFEPEGG